MPDACDLPREQGLTWPRARQALLRCACCAALLFAAHSGLQPRSHIDLYPSYVAARLANEGLWEHIYHPTVWLFRESDDPVWNQRGRALLAPQPLLETSFVYHPWYLQGLRPIAALVPYASFQASWIVLNRLCIVAIGLALALLLRAERWRDQLLLTLVLAFASTSIDSVDVGQNELPALSFALFAALAWRSRAPLWLGGLLAACAWACKPWCAALIVLPFVLRGLRAGVMTAAGLGFAMVILPELCMPAALMRDYRAALAGMAGMSNIAFNNVSLLASLERLTTPDWLQRLDDWAPHVAPLWSRVLAHSLTLILFASGAWVWWRRRPAVRYTIAAYLAFMLVPLGICWTHYFVFAFPLACLCTFDERSRWLLRAAGFALLALLFGLMEFLQIGGHPLWTALLQPAVHPWQHATPMLLLVATCFAALSLAPRDAHDTR